MGLSVSEDEPEEEPEDAFHIDSIRGTLSEGPIIMNAIRDSETGEMVATDVISASKVTARFRNVAERAGYVSISFDVSVPASMSDSKWQLKIFFYLVTLTPCQNPTYSHSKQQAVFQDSNTLC